MLDWLAIAEMNYRDKT